jgi:hypothetical protein
MNRPAEPNPARDWSTKAGAEALAELVRRYWRDRGFPPHVEVWIEPQRGGREPLVVIKRASGPGAFHPASPATVVTVRAL